MLDALKRKLIALDVPHTVDDGVGYEDGGEEEIGERESEYGLVVHLAFEANARGAYEAGAHEIAASSLLVQVDANEE